MTDANEGTATNRAIANMVREVAYRKRYMAGVETSSPGSISMTVPEAELILKALGPSSSVGDVPTVGYWCTGCQQHYSRSLRHCPNCNGRGGALSTPSTDGDAVSMNGENVDTATPSSVFQSLHVDGKGNVVQPVSVHARVDKMPDGVADVIDDYCAAIINADSPEAELAARKECFAALTAMVDEAVRKEREEIITAVQSLSIEPKPNQAEQRISEWCKTGVVEFIRSRPSPSRPVGGATHG